MPKYKCLNFVATFQDKIKGTVRFHQCNPQKFMLVIYMNLEI